jgi:molybdopterin-guanine dinucleotide biosynthesis protein A
MEEVTCAILSGGMSTRLGRDKATATAAGKPLLKHVYDIARRVFPRIMVVSSLHNAVDGVAAPMVADILPVRGSLTGIVSALINADTEYVFVLGGDMPFRHRGGHAHVAARAGRRLSSFPARGRLEPMHASTGGASSRQC